MLREEKSWKVLLDEMTNGVITIEDNLNPSYANPASFKIFRLENTDGNEKLKEIIKKSKIVITTT